MNYEPSSLIFDFSPYGRRPSVQLSILNHQLFTLTQTYVIYDLILLRRLFRFLARFDDGDMPAGAAGVYDDGELHDKMSHHKDVAREQNERIYRCNHPNCLGRQSVVFQ